MLPNEYTFEFGQARLKLKDRLRFTMRRNGARIWYLVEDDVCNKFFQIGLPQYTFLSMLDGTQTVNAVLMKTASVLRQDAIDENEAASLCQWAIQVGLVESELSNSLSRRETSATAETFKKSLGWLNPITLKLKLFRPDAMATAAERMLGWLISPLGALLWLLIVIYGFFQLTSHWDGFVVQRVSAFGKNDLLWLAGTWLILKLFHECAHSICCKRFGGRIQSCGVLLLLLIPLPFVDVTSSWRFENKWHRILTSAAGMLAEILLAAIACCIWVASGPGPMQYHAGNVIVAATLHTLLFNANPLMRFDGYYILSDLIEIPNLSAQGRNYVKGLFRRIYFNKTSRPISEIGMRGLAVKLSGFLAIGWSLLIALSLILGAASLLEGVGLILAIVGATLWFGIPLFRFMKLILVGNEFETIDYRWFASAVSLTAAFLLAVLFLCPGPSVVSAPVVIDYEPFYLVRAQASGFANQIHVDNGETVQKGQLLLTLQNPDLMSELEALQIDSRISKLRIDSMLKAGEIAAMQVEEESLESMTQRQDELTSLIKKLEVRAPQAGTVLAMDLKASEGIYFHPGDEILSLATPGKTQAIALARQQDIAWLEQTPDASVDLVIWGHNERAFHGVIDRINPRARDDIPHQAFAASHGGPLSVVPRGQVEGDAGQQDNGLMLTAPRVPVEISLLGEDRDRLLSGQTGMMLVRSRSLNMGGFLFAKARKFVSDKIERTHGL